MIRQCPCGAGAGFDECCGRLHSGSARAATAEQLMRSRFAAFYVGDESYLLASWHPSTRPRSVEFEPELRWIRLEILDRTGGGPFDLQGTVEFAAHYELSGASGALREHSRFRRENGSWFYVDGDHH
ncbi:hypothetical protein D5S17_24705 [Pseudonocardiaceae bacterium YIM PH 21723]|nr:hypothetical protein D5S17_24705 [Pseudonocardiaceae bacterium YIM PH 21723]